jgi:hypothetical protein
MTAELGLEKGGAVGGVRISGANGDKRMEDSVRLESSDFGIQMDLEEERSFNFLRFSMEEMADVRIVRIFWQRQPGGMPAAVKNFLSSNVH